MSAIRKISARLGGSAFTRTRIISRSINSSSVRSTTLMTSIKRLSCLSTCSITQSSPWTTRVTRDTEASIVSPTETLSMLYPLAAIKPAILAKTPTWFSTRRVRMCRRGGICPFMPSSVPCLRRLVRGRSWSPDDVGDGSPGRDRREAVFLPLHHHIDHDRSRGVDGLLDPRLHVLRPLNPDPHGAVGLREFHKVGLMHRARGQGLVCGEGRGGAVGGGRRPPPPPPGPGEERGGGASPPGKTWPPHPGGGPTPVAMM